MTIAERLAELVKKDQLRVDRYINNIEGAGRAFKRSFERVLSERLSDLLLDDNGFILDKQIARQRLEQIANDLPFILNEAGVQKMTETMLAQINKRLRTVDTIWRELGLESLVIGPSVGDLPAVSEQLSYVINSVDKGTRQSRVSIMREITQYRQELGSDSERKLSTMIENLTTKAGVLPKYAGTVANTSLMGIDRSVRRAQGQKGGLEYAKYMGPDDKITRPFCKAHVGRVETWDYWDVVPNGTTLLPVSVYGGSWNCRHDLVPYDPEWDNIEL